jgi:hypothetical protein
MDPKFRPALARRMTLEVLEARYTPRWSREAIEGLAIMLDDLGVPDDDDDFFGDNPRDPFVEFRTIERDMKAALEALDALGFELLKLEPALAKLEALG